MSIVRTVSVFGLTALLAAGCERVDIEAKECAAMRDIGRSSEKTELIRKWIESTLADPNALAKTGRKNGPLIAIESNLGLDGEMIGIPSELLIVEFYGEAVDYRNLTPDSVEAVTIGYAFGYKLVFNLRQTGNIEKTLNENAKRPYGAIRREELEPGLTLVCQYRG